MKDRPWDVAIVEDDPTDAEPTVRALRRAEPAGPVTVGNDGAESLDFLFGTGRRSGRPNGETPGSTGRRGEAGA